MNTIALQWQAFERKLVTAGEGTSLSEARRAFCAGAKAMQALEQNIRQQGGPVRCGMRNHLDYELTSFAIAVVEGKA